MTSVSWDSRRLYINNKPFYIHGMNLFLDRRRPEKTPRIIYSPPSVSDEVLGRIIVNLKDLGINTVRIWPTIKEGKHISSISNTVFSKFEKAGIYIILNLPVNWNQKPSLLEIKRFLKNYHVSYHRIVPVVVDLKQTQYYLEKHCLNRHYWKQRQHHRPVIYFLF